MSSLSSTYAYVCGHSITHPFHSQIQTGPINFYAKTCNSSGLPLQIYIHPFTYVSLIVVPYPR